MNEVITTISEAMKSKAEIDSGVISLDRTIYDDNLPEGISPEIADTVNQYNIDFTAATGLAVGEMGFESEEDELSATVEFGAGCVEHLYQRSVEINGELKSNYLTSTLTHDFGNSEAAMALVIQQVSELAKEEETED